MSELWVGMSVTSNVIIVGLEFENDQIQVSEDTTWALQQGDRSEAYVVMYERIFNYLKERNIEHVVVKGSVASTHGSGLAHLHAAELRGVVITAATQSGAKVHVINKATISRTFGKRKVDDYVKDDEFWAETLEKQVKKGSRETALLILAARNK